MLKIDYRIRENERKMTDHLYDTLEEIGKTAGSSGCISHGARLDSNGSAIHEHGCAAWERIPSAPH